MKILFLSLDSFDGYDVGNMYSDLLRVAITAGHEIFSIVPNESENRVRMIESMGSKILKINTGQVTGNANLIKKGINTLLLGRRYKNAVKKYCKKLSFDLILYATPPITIYKAIKYAKKKTGAKTYLLLKDIFPQNAVDLGILSKKGLKGLITGYFRRTEKKYYKISDSIGCMSNRNVEYLLKNNQYISPKKVCVNPNSVDIENIGNISEDKLELRKKYSIPEKARIFLYGGNLGRPQDVPFIVRCLQENVNKKDRFFIISGKGSDYSVIKDFFEQSSPENMILINGLPREEYDILASMCDIGLIFLDYRFTIPNYPSRLLSYLKSGLPVIACTDTSTDIGDDILAGGFGWKCYSNDVRGFTEAVDDACTADLSDMQKNARNYLVENFSAEKSMNDILRFAAEAK
ncbi:MAG: glycosyltransferase family 4 protein [Christensenellales bacterium]